MTAASEVAPRREWLNGGRAALAKGWERETDGGVEWEPIPDEAVERAIEKLVWEPLAGAKPFSPGFAIEACIRQFRIPKVTRIAISHDLAPYGFYGIEAHYKLGRTLLYVLDMGLSLQAVCYDLYAEEGAS